MVPLDNGKGSQVEARPPEYRNLITACYVCNDIKNMIAASDLGWEAEIPEQDWDGLTRYLAVLKDGARAETPS